MDTLERRLEVKKGPHIVRVPWDLFKGGFISQPPPRPFRLIAHGGAYVKGAMAFKEHGNTHKTKNPYDFHSLSGRGFGRRWNEGFRDAQAGKA